jgi:hypothetical protein
VGISFLRGRGWPPKWAFHLLRGNFYIYFRKDATKYLNQILKKQQMGNSRAGLGMNPELAGYGKNQQNRKNFSSFRH